MHAAARISVLAVIVAASAAAPALAFSPVEDAALWEIPRPGEPSRVGWEWRRAALHDVGPLGDTAAGSAMAAFAGESGGRWHYQINSATGTFHHVCGSGIDLGRTVESAASSEALAREFIGENRDLFGIGNDDLVVMSNTGAPGKRSVIFQQTYRGLRVWGGRAHLVFTESGRLIAFGSDVYPDIDVGVVPQIPRKDALGIAAGDIGFEYESDSVDRTELLILPVEAVDGIIDYRLVYRFDLNMAEPFGIWVTWVDASSGEILWRENHIRFADYGGHVRGDVEWDGYCDGDTHDYPLKNMRISISGAGICYTDENGGFMLSDGSGPRAISAGFSGRWVNVDRDTGTDAGHSGIITDGVPYAIDWDDANSMDSERDVFAYVNREHDWLKAIDPEWTGTDYEMPATVERTDLYCPGNGWWDGTGINLCAESVEYGNTGRMGDVVYHEYGHAITQFIYGINEPPSHLHEGNSDIVANYLTRDSRMGIGYYLDNCSSGIRDSDNNMTYPCTGSGHVCGQVIAGFHWDAWQEMLAVYPQAYADSVAMYTWHYGRKMGLPQTQPDQVYWTFVADDDDGDLDNGTPHHYYFCTAAANHNFACPAITAGVIITHTPLDDTGNTTTPYAVTALITSTAGSIVPSTCRVTFRVDGGGLVDSAMTPTGTPDEYVGYIPAQPPCTGVEYYIYAEDDEANSATHPLAAPEFLHAFGVGYDVVFSDTFEADLGWTAGLPGDDASSGIWERCNPQETEAQPEDDHTPGLFYNAYITDCAAGISQGSYDVDGGKTTLQSPVFDLTGCTSARAVYYRWYSNDTGGGPGEDFWVVQVTDDDWASHAVLENTNQSERSWQKVQINLGDYIDLTDRVQFRFIASDENAGSVVEAGVDDFSIIGCPGAGDTLAPAVTVTVPNGGELFLGGDDTPYPVTWNSYDDVGIVMTHILLSIDGGATYPDTVVAAPLDSAYDWFVPPQYQSETCRIKVICVDAAANEGYDESDGDFEIRSQGDVPAFVVPPTVVLMQNRPSPFDAYTVIEFGLPLMRDVSLAVYDVKGRLVTCLAEGVREAGYHSVIWTGSDAAGAMVPPGVYFYRLVAGNKALTRKMLLVK